MNLKECNYKVESMEIHEWTVHVYVYIHYADTGDTHIAWMAQYTIHDWNCWQSCQTFTSMTYTYACTFCVVNVSRHNVSVETSKEETPIQRRCDFRGRVDTFNYKSTYIYIYIYFQILLHLRFALFWKIEL